MIQLDSLTAPDITHFDRTTRPRGGDCRRSDHVRRRPPRLLGFAPRRAWWLHGITCRPAAEHVAPNCSVRTVATSFLRPGAVGPARLDVEVLRERTIVHDPADRSPSSWQTRVHESGDCAHREWWARVVWRRDGSRSTSEQLRGSSASRRRQFAISNMPSCASTRRRSLMERQTSPGLPVTYGHWSVDLLMQPGW